MAQVGLQATGDLSYNGYEFTAAHNVTVQVRYKRDSGGRDVIAHEHLITVDFVVANDDGTDAEMEDIRRRLGEAGKTLIFRQKGFGNDLIVNRTATSQSDIENGPFPEVLEWTPVGNNLAAQVRWQVKVTTAPCSGRARTAGVQSIDYGMEWVIDEHGETVRTINGSITVVARRGISSADQFRNRFIAPTLAGFNRRQTYTLTEDKRTLNFRIVDSRIPSPNPYAPGMTAMEGTHNVSFDAHSGVMVNRVACRIRAHANFNPSQTWQIFLDIAARRLRAAKQRQKGAILLTGLDVEEDLFGRAQTFAVTWEVIRELRDFVSESALWEPLGGDWNLWRLSMEQVFGSRGNRGLDHLLDVPANDVVVDLCGGNGQANVVINNRQRAPFVGNPTRVKHLKNDTPDPEYSWLDYKNEVIPHRECPVSRQPIIQQERSTGGEWEVDQGTPPDRPADYGPQPEDAIPDKVQSAGMPRYGFRLLGFARRAGHRIPRPAIKTIGSIQAHEVRAVMRQVVAGNYFGVPVYQAAWSADYILTGSPGRVNYFNDQKLKVDGVANTAVG